MYLAKAILGTRDSPSSADDSQKGRDQYRKLLLQQAYACICRARRFKKNGRLLLVPAQIQRGRRTLHKLIGMETGTPNLAARFLLVALLFEEGEFQEARTEAICILHSLKPNQQVAMEDPVLQLAISHSAWRIGQNWAALGPLVDATEAFPNHPQLYLALAEHWLSMCGYGSAKDMAQLALLRHESDLCQARLSYGGVERTTICLAMARFQLDLTLEDDYLLQRSMAAQDLSPQEVKELCAFHCHRLHHRSPDNQQVFAGERVPHAFTTAVKPASPLRQPSSPARQPPSPGQFVQQPAPELQKRRTCPSIEKPIPVVSGGDVDDDSSPRNLPHSMHDGESDVLSSSNCKMCPAASLLPTKGSSPKGPSSAGSSHEEYVQVPTPYVEDAIDMPTLSAVELPARHLVRLDTPHEPEKTSVRFDTLREPKSDTTSEVVLANTVDPFWDVVATEERCSAPPPRLHYRSTAPDLEENIDNRPTGEAARDVTGPQWFWPLSPRHSQDVTSSDGLTDPFCSAQNETGDTAHELSSVKLDGNVLTKTIAEHLTETEDQPSTSFYKAHLSSRTMAAASSAEVVGRTRKPSRYARPAPSKTQRHRQQRRTADRDQVLLAEATDASSMLFSEATRLSDLASCVQEATWTQQTWSLTQPIYEITEPIYEMPPDTVLSESSPGQMRFAVNAPNAVEFSRNGDDSESEELLQDFDLFRLWPGGHRQQAEGQRQMLDSQGLSTNYDGWEGYLGLWCCHRNVTLNQSEENAQVDSAM